MRALAGTDDRTFVEVMQRINVVIVNPWFLISFLGSIAAHGRRGAGSPER